MDEKIRLVHAMNKYGTCINACATIKNDFAYGFIFCRTNVDLKDCWRNIKNARCPRDSQLLETSASSWTPSMFTWEQRLQYMLYFGVRLGEEELEIYRKILEIDGWVSEGCVSDFICHPDDEGSCIQQYAGEEVMPPIQDSGLHEDIGGYDASHNLLATTNATESPIRDHNSPEQNPSGVPSSNLTKSARKNLIHVPKRKVSLISKLRIFYGGEEDGFSESDSRRRLFKSGYRPFADDWTEWLDLLVSDGTLEQVARRGKPRYRFT